MTQPQALIRVILKRGRSKPFWVGHPWVFSGAIHQVSGPVGDTGGPCLIEDERKNVLGTGFYNPHGRIAVRILQHRRTTDLPFEPRGFQPLVRERLAMALQARENLGLPSAATTVYRVVNSEGDLLSGLIVDRFGDVAVMQTGSRAMYEARELLADEVKSLLGVRAVVNSISDTSSKLEVIPSGTDLLRGAVEGTVQVLEGGVRFEVDPLSGQKTGFYADQRDNRRRFAATCGGREVLDLYAYVGAFGLHALAAGAARVHAVDASGPACAAATRNAQINGVSDRHEVSCGDAMNWLKEARAQGRTFSRIVCDPPKFAHGRGHLDDALKKYARLNTLALSLLEPGGLLLTCSCSQHVSEDAFLRVLNDAGHRLRRAVRVHAVWGQGVDHPYAAVAPEGRYLTAALVSVSSS